MTSPGDWWVQWPALGLGIAWVINLFKVMRTLVVLGGLAGLAALIGPSRRPLVAAWPSRRRLQA